MRRNRNARPIERPTPMQGISERPLSVPVQLASPEPPTIEQVALDLSELFCGQVRITHRGRA